LRGQNVPGNTGFLDGQVDGTRGLLAKGSNGKAVGAKETNRPLGLKGKKKPNSGKQTFDYKNENQDMKDVYLRNHSTKRPKL